MRESVNQKQIMNKFRIMVLTNEKIKKPLEMRVGVGRLLLSQLLIFCTTSIILLF